MKKNYLNFVMLLAVGVISILQACKKDDPFSLPHVPDHYLQTPGGEPQMGAHWVDLLSPEFSPGGSFTKTFIWGSYDGKFIFWEPMITREYLLSDPNDLIELRQPSAFQRDGYYATHYKVSYSSTPKEYTVSLMNLIYHEGE